jgi:hypothetical protein
MTPRLAVARRIAIALVLATALPTFADPPGGRRHLDVKGEQDCAACHRVRTPEVFAAWERSPHGLALVKCVVCHGSTGADFRARPAAVGCRGCHPGQVESVSRRTVKDCFACHRAHALTPNPHR